MISPENIDLNDLTKMFEYAKLCKEIDECENIEEIKITFKSYLKLYFSTLETIKDIGNI